MNIIRKWLLRKMTVDELVYYFHKKGITIDMKFEKKKYPLYYAKNSRMYRIDK